MYDGYLVAFPWVKRSGHGGDQPFPSNTGVDMDGAISLLPPEPAVGCNVAAFTFVLNYDFPVSALNHSEWNIIFTVLYWNIACWPWLSADLNCGELCAACHHAKWSLKWKCYRPDKLMTLYFSIVHTRIKIRDLFKIALLGSIICSYHEILLT